MHSKPPRQHYISRFLMKEWADGSGRIGVVCTYHRDSVIVSPNGLHYVRSLSSPEQEESWSDQESRAKAMIAESKKLLGSGGENWGRAEEFLSEPENFELLVGFVALHHARSLEVRLRHLLKPGDGGDVAESEADIQTRLNSTKGYYDCGVDLVVFPQDSSLGLGAIPVFDEESWGAHKPGSARFMMPLTPSVMICGTTDRPGGQVRVVSSSIRFEDLLHFSLAGAPGLFSTPYVICQPSALERTANEVLALTEGGWMHWYALRNRIDLCMASVSRGLGRDWHDRIQRYGLNQGLYGDPTTTESGKAEIGISMRENARKIQRDLDAHGAPVCACKQHRQNSAVSNLWKSVMPQVICDDIRRNRNIG